MSQISQVFRRGGIVYLEGFVRNGSHENWAGLHQHDLAPENGRLIHFSRDGTRTDLTSALSLQCIHQDTVPFSRRSINAVGYEMPPDIDPAANYQLWDWYVMVFQKRLP